MCGIAGGWLRQALEREVIEETLGLMRRRGPDQYGQKHIESEDKHIHLLHSRLAITDIQARAVQPMYREGLYLVYNGEIYNHREIASELELRYGVKFRTTSDSEVILAAWNIWGEGSIERFIGMWSFVIYDSKVGKLYMCRDRFGEKPLYYIRDVRGIYFASEIKYLFKLRGMRSGLDRDMLCRYFLYGYREIYKGSGSFYKDIQVLPAASLMSIDVRGESKLRTYWELSYEPEKMCRVEARELLREEVERAVSSCYRGDVESAVRLSGGVDSNIIAGIGSERGIVPPLYSIVGNDSRYDESASIGGVYKWLETKSGGKRQVRKQVQMSSDNRESLGFLRYLCSNFDAPVMTITFWLASWLSRSMREEGIKVSLGGTGADEIFGGYYDHYLLWLRGNRVEENYGCLLREWEENMGRELRNPYYKDSELFHQTYPQLRYLYKGIEESSKLWRGEKLPIIAAKRYSESELRDRMLNEIRHETLPLLLHEDDINGMIFSVENRAPFLDHRLASLSFRIDDNILLGEGRGKRLLRESSRDWIAPEVYRESVKRGFNASFFHIIDKHNPYWREQLLEDSVLFDYISYEELKSYSERVMGESYTEDNSRIVFSLFSLKYFLESEESRIDGELVEPQYADYN